MKILITFLSTLAALLTAAVVCGFAFNPVIIFSSCIASGIVGLFVADYRAKPDYRLEVAPAPVVIRSRRAPARRMEASPVFASLIVFNTTIA